MKRKKKWNKEAKQTAFTCAGDVRDRVESRDEQPLLARAELDVDTEKGEGRREKGERVFVSGFIFFV